MGGQRRRIIAANKFQSNKVRKHNVLGRNGRECQEAETIVPRLVEKFALLHRNDRVINATDLLVTTSPVAAAKALLSHVLWSRDPETGDLTAGAITEAEAYGGPDDTASHGFRVKMTKRNAAMFAGGGTAYVYICYGIHTMLNVSVGPPGEPAAVLVRALQPLVGVDVMARRRQKAASAPRRAGDLINLCRGPGCLAQAMSVKPGDNGLDLLEGQRLWITRPLDGRALWDFLTAELVTGPLKLVNAETRTADPGHVGPQCTVEREVSLDNSNRVSVSPSSHEDVVAETNSPTELMVVGSPATAGATLLSSESSPSGCNSTICAQKQPPQIAAAAVSSSDQTATSEAVVLRLRPGYSFSTHSSNKPHVSPAPEGATIAAASDSPLQAGAADAAARAAATAAVDMTLQKWYRSLWYSRQYVALPVTQTARIGVDGAGLPAAAFEYRFFVCGDKSVSRSSAGSKRAQHTGHVAALETVKTVVK